MSEQYRKVIELIDAANGADPNIECVQGREWPKELLYSHRMSRMLERYRPDAGEVERIAIRAQQIERWRSPRSDFPMTRIGYLQWRTRLYRFHAETATALMERAGYDGAAIGRVAKAIGKKAVKVNPDTQLLEDVAALVFLEHYPQGFADRHPEYDETKWIDILRKTWNKMSRDAQAFALSGDVALPQPLRPLIDKALA